MFFGIALSAGSAPADARSWETVDDIFPGGSAGGVAAGAAGIVHVAGSITDGTGISHAVVMRSADFGTTWDSNPSTPDVDEPAVTYTSSSGARSFFRGIATALVGTGQTASYHVVAAGPTENFQWLVCRSLDGGETWQTPELYQHPGTITAGGPVKPALDASGNIYVAGSVTEQVTSTSRGKKSTTTVERSLIRKYDIVCGSWSTLSITFPVRGLVCSGDSVFAISSTDSGAWQVRKSMDGAITWGSALDEYRLDLSGSSIAADVAVDSQGNLFVVGMGERVTKSGSGKNQTTLFDRFWIVRKGTAGGTQWTTLDVFDLGRPPINLGGGQYAGAMSFANAVTVGPDDTVHVTGAAVGAAENRQHWVTRSLAVGSVEWTTDDDFNLTPGSTYSHAKGVAADASGNLYSCGFSDGGPDGGHRWIVRRALTMTP